MPSAPALSRRTSELGTENAFVVLAEVNELARAGRDMPAPEGHTFRDRYAKKARK